MARYMDADKLIEMLNRQIECEWNTIAAPGTWADAFQDFSDLVEQTPTADVVLKSEIAREILSDLKRQIHDKAIYPGARDAYSFVNIKVFDAVLNNVLIKYTEGVK